MELDSLKKVILFVSDGLDKRTKKITNEKFSKLSEEDIKLVVKKLDITDQTDLANKILIMFFLNNKPAIKLPLSFSQYEDVKLMFKRLRNG